MIVDAHIHALLDIGDALAEGQLVAVNLEARRCRRCYAELPPDEPTRRVCPGCERLHADEIRDLEAARALDAQAEQAPQASFARCRILSNAAKLRAQHVGMTTAAQLSRSRPAGARR